MDSGVSTLESDVAAMRGHIEVIHSNYATNDALLSAKNDLQLKIIESHDSLDRKIDRVAAEQGPKMQAIANAGDMKLDALNFSLEELANANASKLAQLELKLVTSIGELRSEMDKQAIRLRNWFLATALSLFVGFGALVNAMFNVLRS